jgi:uncharacterized repeat protein (TIGR02543 family)
MNSDKNITANFAINMYTLTVNATNGTVAKVPDQASYESGSVVQLMATAAPGYLFTGWSGDVIITANPIDVTMDANKNITANFTIKTYSLTVAGTNGSVEKNPDQALYDSNATVQLTAIPITGYHFTNWSGDQTGSVNPVDVVMDRNKNITANFAINMYTLTVNVMNGTVTKNPDQATYIHNTIVQLTAIPATGYLFTGWSGDVISTANPIDVKMDADKNITANFALKVELNAGWTLVSMPLQQSNDSAHVVFPKKYGEMFGYSQEKNDYVEEKTLVLGRGYWVFYHSMETIQIGGSIPAPGTDTITANIAGWILIGSREKVVQVADLQLSNGATLYGEAFCYDPVLDDYRTTTVINPCQGIWVYVTKPCIITIP